MLRDYQTRALTALERHWREGTRRVCLVAPTGAGKSHIGAEIPAVAARVLSLDNPRVLWIVHRDTLIRQASAKLRGAGYEVGCISPNYPPDPWATVQVASVDTLIAREHRPPAELVLWDEAHHAAATTYRTVLDSYPDTLHVGLTATPQRRDGKPLGDHYDALVIAAQYSELVAAGHIVGCRVFRPDDYLGSDLARQPLEAWQALTPNAQTFAFAPTVPRAREWAAQFSDAGIPSAHIEADTPTDQRERILDAFRRGELRVLWNVYVLTEGVDVPAAECCLLARGVSHAGPYLQIVGRVLRPAPGKTSATLIDLSGASHLHGFPTQDRQYALTGRSIQVVGEALKNCPQCGGTIPQASPVCELCGYVFPRTERRKPKIWDLELRLAVESGLVGDGDKLREWNRLRRLCESRGWSLSWAVKQFREQLEEPVPQEWLANVTDAEKRREYANLVNLGRERGFKPGFAAMRYRSLFNQWPPRAWGRTG